MGTRQVCTTDWGGEQPTADRLTSVTRTTANSGQTDFSDKERPRTRFPALAPCDVGRSNSAGVGVSFALQDGLYPLDASTQHLSLEL